MAGPLVFLASKQGGLIAGAYASGMTPPEIRELMRSSDWEAPGRGTMVLLRLPRASTCLPT